MQWEIVYFYSCYQRCTVRETIFVFLFFLIAIHTLGGSKYNTIESIAEYAGKKSLNLIICLWTKNVQSLYNYNIFLRMVTDVTIDNKAFYPGFSQVVSYLRCYLLTRLNPSTRGNLLLIRSYYFFLLSARAKITKTQYLLNGERRRVTKMGRKIGKWSIQITNVRTQVLSRR